MAGARRRSPRPSGSNRRHDRCASRGPCPPRPSLAARALQYDTDGKLAVGGAGCRRTREGMGLRRVRPADSHLRITDGPLLAPRLGARRGSDPSERRDGGDPTRRAGGRPTGGPELHGSSRQRTGRGRIRRKAAPEASSSAETTSIQLWDVGTGQPIGDADPSHLHLLERSAGMTTNGKTVVAPRPRTPPHDDLGSRPGGVAGAGVRGRRPQSHSRRVDQVPPRGRAVPRDLSAVSGRHVTILDRLRTPTSRVQDVADLPGSRGTFMEIQVLGPVEVRDNDTEVPSRRSTPTETARGPRHSRRQGGVGRAADRRGVGRRGATRAGGKDAQHLPVETSRRPRDGLVRVGKGS